MYRFGGDRREATLRDLVALFPRTSLCCTNSYWMSPLMPKARQTEGNVCLASVVCQEHISQLLVHVHIHQHTYIFTNESATLCYLLKHLWGPINHVSMFCVPYKYALRLPTKVLHPIETSLIFFLTTTVPRPGLSSQWNVNKCL